MHTSRGLSSNSQPTPIPTDSFPGGIRSSLKQQGVVRITTVVTPVVTLSAVNTGNLQSYLSDISPALRYSNKFYIRNIRHESPQFVTKFNVNVNNWNLLLLYT